MSNLLAPRWRGRDYLLSPLADFLMSGGLALLCIVLIAAFIPYEKTTVADVIPAAYLAAGFYWLAYAVNYPHFMLSYQLLYGNFRARLREHQGHADMWWRTVSAGVLVPLALLTLLAFTFVSLKHGDRTLMGVCLQLMFFFVGWHYVKQAFGVMMMLSALKQIFYSASARRVLLWNAYLVWLASWVYMSYTSQFLGVAFQQGAASKDSVFGYEALVVPDVIRVPLLVAAIFSTLAATWVIAAQWRRTRVRPSLTALIGYGSMYYLWAFVAVLHPEWALAAPFFHSLQYLLFVVAYKRGETANALHAAACPNMAAEAALALRLRNRRQHYFAFSFLLGVLAFSVLPYQASRAYGGGLALDVFVLMSVIFINIHHYFIDNVLWRKENKAVGANLLGWRKSSSSAAHRAVGDLVQR